MVIAILSLAVDTHYTISIVTLVAYCCTWVLSLRYFQAGVKDMVVLTEPIEDVWRSTSDSLYVVRRLVYSILPLLPY